MLSRAALVCVALLGVTLCVTAQAGDAGELLDNSAALGSDHRDLKEVAGGRKLLTIPLATISIDQEQNANGNSGQVNQDQDALVGKDNYAETHQKNKDNKKNKSVVKEEKKPKGGRNLLTTPIATITIDQEQNANGNSGQVNQDQDALVGKDNYAETHQKNKDNKKNKSVEKEEKKRKGGRNLLDIPLATISINQEQNAIVNSGQVNQNQVALVGEGNYAETYQSNKGNKYNTSVQKKEKKSKGKFWG